MEPEPNYPAPPQHRIDSASQQPGQKKWRAIWDVEIQLDGPRPTTQIPRTRAELPAQLDKESQKPILPDHFSRSPMPLSLIVTLPWEEPSVPVTESVLEVDSVVTP